VRPQVATAAAAAAERSGAEAAHDKEFASPSSNSTATATEYTKKTVVLTFVDPLLPFALERVVAADQKLLRHYERGLPSWAVFMPSYGLPYRPWFRRVYEIVFILTSFVAVVCGFYDLYKNIPGAREVMLSLYAPLLHWLEVHSSMRLSILASYLLSKFVVLEMMVVNLSAVAKRLRSVLAAVVRPVVLLSREAAEAAAWLAAAAAPAVRALGTLCTWLAAPFLHGGFTVLVVFKVIFVESFELLGLVLLAPLRLVRVLFGLTRGVVGASKGAAAAAAVAADTGADNWLLLGLRGVSWNPFQASFYLVNRLWKDIKSIITFFVHICGIVNQHRLRCAAEPVFCAVQHAPVMVGLGVRNLGSHS
jgi:hypothetical protein